MSDVSSGDEKLPTRNNNTKDNRSDSIKLYSYSQIFYFWPVWFVCLAMGGMLTFMESPPFQEHYGLIFVGILIYTITATAIMINGQWFLTLTAVFVIMAMAAVMTEVDQQILDFIAELQLNANAGFYLAIGSVLLIAWILTTFVFDRLRYVELRRGQIAVRHVIGNAAEGYDTKGLRYRKTRDNFAQHWILGMGTFDVVFIPQTADASPIIWRNVMGSRKKLRKINNILGK